MVDGLHRQRVLNFLEMFYAGDIEGALSRCTDDVEFFANAPIDILPHMGHHRGKDELRAMWQTVHARYSNMRYEVPILVAEGDKVAANIRVFFRKSSNDRVVQFDIAAFYTLRDGRIAEISEIMDTFDLVQQVLERDVIADLTANSTRYSLQRHSGRESARMTSPDIAFINALNLAAAGCDQPRALADIDRRKYIHENRVAGVTGSDAGRAGRCRARRRRRACLGRNLQDQQL